MCMYFDAPLILIGSTIGNLSIDLAFKISVSVILFVCLELFW